jgi:hypothetical protein
MDYQKSDIEIEVYRKYPKDKEELTCRTKRDYMNGLREAYRQRLLNDAATATTVEGAQTKTV